MVQGRQVDASWKADGEAAGPRPACGEGGRVGLSAHSQGDCGHKARGGREEASCGGKTGQDGGDPQDSGERKEERLRAGGRTERLRQHSLGLHGGPRRAESPRLLARPDEQAQGRCRGANLALEQTAPRRLHTILHLPVLPFLQRAAHRNPARLPAGTGTARLDEDSALVQVPRAVAEPIARLDQHENKEFDMKKEHPEMPEKESKVILYTTDDGKAQVSLMSRDGRVWLNQKQMAELFAVSKPNISMLIAKIFAENELDDSVVKPYLTTAADGKRYKVIYYALEMILAVGFRVRGVRGTQFRQWANAHLSEYLIKGFTMDDERLKNPDGRPDYFDELLARIRDIRASEKRFYQKVRDLFALSSDYRGNEAKTLQFFAEVQNKLLFAATGHTAAELIVQRSDPNKPNMGLTTWKGGIVRKEDVIVAKNYLSSDEIDTLNRITTIFLEAAELRVNYY